MATISARVLLSLPILHKRRLFEQSFHAFLIYHLHTEFLGFLKFRSGVRAGNHVIRLLAYGPGHFAAGVFDEFFGFVAGVGG